MSIFGDIQKEFEEMTRLYEAERALADRQEEEIRALQAENRDLQAQLESLRHVMEACAIKPPAEIEVPPALPENLSELPVLNLDDFYEDRT